MFLNLFRWPKNREFYTLWDFFTPAFNCPHEVERIGILGDGGTVPHLLAPNQNLLSCEGKWVCGLNRIARKKGCTIYSFGNYF